MEEEKIRCRNSVTKEGIRYLNLEDYTSAMYDWIENGTKGLKFFENTTKSVVGRRRKSCRDLWKGNDVQDRD